MTRLSARRQLIAALSEDSFGGIATLSDVDRAERLADAHAAEVLAAVTDPADAATSYAVRPCICEETPHPAWCPASVPTDERIAEIRQGVGERLTPRELFWLKGAAGRHELHVTGARGGHWPLTDDLPGALLLVSQYLAAAVAVIERAGLVQQMVCAACGEPVVRFACEQTGGGWMHQDASDDPAAGADHAAVPVVAPEEKASAAAPEVTPFFQPQHTYAHGGYRFRCEYLVTHPTSGRTFAWGWFGKQGAGWRHASFSDRQYAARTWTDVTTTLGDST